MIKFPFAKVPGAESCWRPTNFPKRCQELKAVEGQQILRKRCKELKAVEGQQIFRKGCLELKAVRLEYGPLQ